MTPQEFVDMCTKLKELGASRVEAENYAATFIQPVQVITRNQSESKPVDVTPKDLTSASQEELIEDLRKNLDF